MIRQLNSNVQLLRHSHYFQQKTQQSSAQSFELFKKCCSRSHSTQNNNEAEVQPKRLDVAIVGPPNAGMMLVHT